ncbi:MAG: hypothetical protein WCQ99_02375 [Pseudomonadota bacterium]
MKKLLIKSGSSALFFILFTASDFLPEKNYQNIWCQENCGITEAVLDDKTRVDCLTATNAIEFDFAKKWAEAIGQALHYGIKTGKRPGIVIIKKTPSDDHYVEFIKNIIAQYNLPIDVWTITP